MNLDRLFIILLFIKIKLLLNLLILVSQKINLLQLFLKSCLHLLKLCFYFIYKISKLIIFIFVLFYSLIYIC